MFVRADQTSGESEQKGRESIPAGIHFPREQVIEFLSLAQSFLEHQQNIYPPSPDAVVKTLAKQCHFERVTSGGRHELQL